MSNKQWWIVGGLVIIILAIAFYVSYHPKPTPDINTPSVVRPIVVTPVKETPCYETTAGCPDPTRPEITKD